MSSLNHLNSEILGGTRIQKNRYAMSDFTIRFFNAFDIDAYAFLGPHELEDLAAELEIDLVPKVDEFELDHTVEELVEMSEAPSVLNPKATREGIVLRATEEVRDDELGRLSFKVISPKFLLKGGD